jgi:hypothetical protein
MPVKTEHPHYAHMVSKWVRCRDITDGEDAVHAGGEKYLPRLKDQSNDSYAQYVMRTPFYNATWRTIAGLIGMLFRKPPKIEVPSAVKDMLDDITMSGVPFQMFAYEVCEEALKIGRLGILVDYPMVDITGMTLADARRMNLRPMMQIYRAESVINWRTGRVNNVTVLTMLVLKETEDIPVDEFTMKKEDRYRVLDLFESKYRVRIFKIGLDGLDQLLSESFPLMDGKPLDFIPFTFLSTDDNTAECDEPPLIDLVNLNLSHYRSAADLEHGAHFTGLPTPYICGAQLENPSEKLYIGSESAWLLKNPEAQVGFLEFSGQGLQALEKRLEVKEKQMAILGARMLEPQKKGVETSESQSIHRKGEESMLAAAGQSISLGVTRALKWFCTWAGAEDAEVEFELNRDFYPAPMTPQMLTALVTAWQTGAFSDEVLFENLQYGEVIGQDDTFEEEQTRIQQQGPKLKGQDVDPVTGKPAPVGKLSPTRENGNA